ncbi:MAG: alpha/beta fold hydrolase [Terrimicrobiaceae bacterium]|nr:alpha/beta fold hydrolase [Terrimicrobiaceae bacterium]
MTATPAFPSELPRHVVLVHGIWDTARTLGKLDAALRKAGLDTTVVTLSPNDGRVGLDALAAQVRDQIDARIPEHERFSLVGFSMGGLVARSYLRQFGEPRRLAAFISISTPHRGTWMAWLLGNAGARDMRPGSPFLAAVDADAVRYQAASWITIRTPLDLIILPSGSSTLPWARNDSIPVPMHPLMVWDVRVIRLVLHELTATP